jgi:hypothetical protein
MKLIDLHTWARTIGTFISGIAGGCAAIVVPILNGKGNSLWANTALFAAFCVLAYACSKLSKYEKAKN